MLNRFNIGLVLPVVTLFGRFRIVSSEQPCRQRAGCSAEEIYDQLARDLRRARKLATLRGPGAPDLIGADQGRGFVDAEAYCRRALWQGLERCLLGGWRGTLPAGLIEEIRTLAQPPNRDGSRILHW